MMSLLDLISQNTPNLQTHQALLVIGLQNDFIQPDGRLPVDTRNGFVERIQALVPKFRELSANIIWVQTLYEADRLASDPATGEGDAVVVGGLVDGVESSTDDDDDLPGKDQTAPIQSRSSRHRQRALDLLKKVGARKPPKIVPEASQISAEEDEELFLLRRLRREPACLPNTPGADFAEIIRPSIAKTDSILQTTNYSAFLGTSLLLILRAKLITELYICGCITNVSVLATVIDAARHGIRINVIADALGSRKQNRHDEALKRMVEFLDANVVTTGEVLRRKRAEDADKKCDKDKDQQNEEDELETMVGKLRLSEPARTSRTGSIRSSHRSPSIIVNGRQRTLSDASVAESRATTDTKLSDDQFTEMLTQGAKLPDDNRQPMPTTPNLVKSKIRMRSRKKKEDSKTQPPASNTNSESSARPITENATPTKPPRKGEPTVDRSPRSPAIAKAESSDKLRDSTTKREQPLKSSVSHPTLSGHNAENKEYKELRSTPSRMRLALSRSSKSDSNKVLPAQPQKSPTKVTLEPSPRSPNNTTAEPAQKSPTKIISEALPKTPSRTGAEATTIPITPSPSANTTTMGKKLQSLATFPVLRPGDRIADGDSRIIYDFFPPELRHPTDRSKPLKDVIFQQLYNEVRWQKMLHQQGEVPRLVCCQGEFGPDGSMPVYRHPTDQALPLLHFSSKVQVIRKQAEKLVGHPLNHVLIQLYRSGQDFISEHSDKTLDVVKGSSIVNVSFGAQRTMRLRTKKAVPAESIEETGMRNTQRVAMPHNSMFILGLESNKKWLHGIMADKRLEAERSEEERAYSGARISLTFRHIGTFLDAENSTIWGQGATSKEQRDPQDVINDDEEENEKVVRAFSRENHNGDFDWEEWYGDGFNVLHFRNAPEDIPILFASNNQVETKMVQICLWENKINHVLLEAPTDKDEGYEADRQICYRDNDVSHTEVNIAVPILLYLDHYHPLDRDDRGRACTSNSYDILASVSNLLKYWFNLHIPTYRTAFVDAMESLEERQAMGPGPFIAGRRFSVGDCAMWPALDEVIEKWEGWSEVRFPALTEYYRMLWKKQKKSVARLRESLP